MRILFLTVIMALFSVVFVQAASAGLVYEKCEMLYEAVDAICENSDLEELNKDIKKGSLTVDTYFGTCQSLQPSTTEGKSCTQSTDSKGNVECKCTSSSLKVKTK